MKVDAISSTDIDYDRVIIDQSMFTRNLSIIIFVD